MNIIFITLSSINSIRERGIYTDLMRKFRNEGHHVFIVSPCERRTRQPTHIIDIDGVRILKVRTLNIQKTNVIEKGLGTLLIESQYKLAIKKHLNSVRFDLIIYSTPPITFTNVIRFLKQRNPQAVTYLLLKDIFPQNAVDIGMFSERSLLNRYFRRKETALYHASDYIGCMSPANVDFVRRHNPYYPTDKVEVAPNSIELQPTERTDHAERVSIRKKYGLPTDIPIFIYGGNLGRPQGVDFLIKCLDDVKSRKDCFFLVIGNGTEYHKLARWYEMNVGSSVKVMATLPKEDYDILVRSCDIGLIFLDHRFTIPNYPSRLLSYLEYKMPVICATDKNTDIGHIAEKNGYGYWCESVLPEDFTTLVDRMLLSDCKMMGERGYEYLCKNYLVEHTYNAIMKHFKEIEP